MKKILTAGIRHGRTRKNEMIEKKKIKLHNIADFRRENSKTKTQTETNPLLISFIANSIASENLNIYVTISKVQRLYLSRKSQTPTPII